ncbi:Membrane protein, PF09925 family [Leptospira santarosai]|uniref:Membrane protein, PF09925 family n=1 Tax=Leptospira santarosai TaxID=28183 RepID=A0A2P1QUQ5_9LEPT|nr:Membrane protein, PF09925 family [Leptospira santarosai]
MRLEQKLKKWVGAGLIRSEQSEAILNFEEARKTPYLYYSFIILGVVVIGIGVIAIVAANWEEIHDLIKLGAGLTVLSLVAGLAFWKRENPNLLTVLIVLNSILILGMIGLVSQVYHLEGKYYEASILWCVLNFLFLIVTDSKTLIHLWFVGLQIAVVGWIFEHDFDFKRLYWENYFYHSTVGFFTLWLWAERFSLESRKGSFFLWAVLFLIAGSSFFGFLRNMDHAIYESIDTSPGAWLKAVRSWGQIAVYLVALIPGFVLLFDRTRFTKTQRVSLVAGLFAFFLMRLPLFFLYASQETYFAKVWNFFVSLIPFFLFIVFWLGIASAFRSHKRIFDLSLAIIGIRFLYFYFDLFGSLTYTGFGLITSGLLIIGCAIGYLKFKGRVRNFLGEQE